MDPELRTLIAERLNIPVELVTREADLLVDLGADSLVLADLLGEFERTTGVKLSLDELETIRTAGDLQDVVSRK